MRFSRAQVRRMAEDGAGPFNDYLWDRIEQKHREGIWFAVKASIISFFLGAFVQFLIDANINFPG